MCLRLVLVLTLFSCAMVLPAGISDRALAASCDLSEPERGTVAQVKDAETLQLTDGTLVWLIGAKAAQAPLGWRGDDPWPFVKESKEEVELRASGADIELRYGGERTDRHGYALAQIFIVKHGARQ